MNNAVQEFLGLIEVDRRLAEHYGEKFDEPPPGASEADIARLESQTGWKFPPSYHEILRVHDGAPLLWGFSFLGAKGPFNRELLEIMKQLAKGYERMIGVGADREDNLRHLERLGGVYVPDQILFGTDRGRGMLVFETLTRGKTGEMGVALCWSDTLPAERFPTLAAFLGHAREELETRLREETATPAPAKKAAAKSKPAAKASSTGKKASAKPKKTTAKASPKPKGRGRA